ncbi:MAG: precorrin-2 C(20)-methyltransferase [Deltaproteobacteria bacterium]|jgi:precorrin-2/cobalt-factor-2 C20-methyltransferase|nr:precorrin-2 C(20)-methyltransferase [Deltaproteobacteria bacterium]
MDKYGILYGIGVGPGDPDLLTLAAVKALGRVSVVLAAASDKNDHSLAWNIAAPHLPQGVATIKLAFPMTSEPETLDAAWRANLEITLSVLREGKNAAFITLGDPLIYSTFGYLLTLLRQEHPQIRVEVIPGITSFQAAAARTRTILCENGQNLLITPGIRDQAELDADLQLADNAVILKAYRNLAVIKKSLKKDADRNTSPVRGNKLTKNADRPQNDSPTTDKTTAGSREHVFVSRLGLDNELIREGLENIPANSSYLSLILATRKR